MKSIQYMFFIECKKIMLNNEVVSKIKDHSVQLKLYESFFIRLNVKKNQRMRLLIWNEKGCYFLIIDPFCKDCYFS